MSGTDRIDSKLSAAHVDAGDEKKLGYWLNRITVPLLRALLSSVNRLSGSVVPAFEDMTLDGSEGFVPVDATAAPVVITLSAPTALFRPVIVQKIDASANVVILQAPVGVSIISAGGLILAAQGDRVIVVSDETTFYA